MLQLLFTTNLQIKYTMKHVLLLVIGLIGLTTFAQQNQIEMAPGHDVVATPLINRDTFDLQFSFPCIAFTGEYGVETNGSDIYVTQWLGDSIARYDQSGTVLETFTIPGVLKTRDLAYDGQFYYGSPAQSYFYVLDLENKEIISTIQTPDNIRGMAYDPIENVLWTSESWLPKFRKMAMDGTILDSWEAAGITLNHISGLAFDNTSANGPFLWGFSQDSTGAMIVKYDIASQSQTGSMIDVSGLTSNQAYAGGLFIRQMEAKTDISMGGMIQNELVFSLELEYANMLVNIGTQDMLTTFKIHPNPASDFVNIHLELTDQGQVQYHLINQLGQVVQHQTLNIVGSTDLNINTSQLEPGIYFVQISNNNGYSFAKKLIISN